MSITVADFRTRFPEFSDDTLYPDARIQLFIDDTVTLYMGSDETRWSGTYDTAQAYLTAHLLSRGTSSEAGNQSPNAGPVIGKTAGGVSVQKGAVAKDRSDADDFLTSTTYGQQYVSIRSRVFAGVLTTANA